MQLIKPYTSFKKFAGGATMILLVLGAGLAGYIYTHPPAQPTQTELENQTNLLLVKGKYDEAIARWEDKLKSVESDKEKAEIYLQIALVYDNKNDLALAIDSYKKAEALSDKPDGRIVEGIAGAAARANNKVLARTYYQKLISIMNPNDALYEADKAAIERKLKELE